MQKADIFKFTDYRTFLKTYAEEKKRASIHWSLGRWARDLNLSSTAVLTNVLNGKRHPGDKITKNFVQYFRFSDQEKAYFTDLIDLQKLNDKPRLLKLLMEKLGEHHPSGRFIALDDKQFSLISRPYYYVLCELVKVEGFVEDPEWIAKRLIIKLTKTEIKKAIDDLLSLGLLIRSKSGKLLATENHPTSTHDIASEGVRRFHEEALELAKAAIRDVPVLERDITGITFSVDSSQLAEMKRALMEFRRQFLRKFNSRSGADGVMQLELALVPMTKKIKDVSKGESV